MHAASRTETAVLDWLAANQPAMEDLLQRLVDIDSGSADVAGVNAVATVLHAFFATHQVRAAWLPAPHGAALLEANVAEETGAAPALLMGHMDTVFPPGTAAQRPFAVSPERFRGPGVADMKAGLVMNAFVLAAFARAGAGQFPVRALFTTDEEIASPVSRPFIIQAALGAAIALNAEPGRASGNVVVERKGGIFVRIRVAGKATHSGIDFAGGANAIAELAKQLVTLEQLTDLSAGITLNVGLISGGRSINTVAPSAEASIDIRYAQPEQRLPLLASLKQTVQHTTTPGTSAELEIIGEFHPMAPTPESLALFASYQQAARELGFEVEGDATGGCSDAGFAASIGTPTLCGVGPVGGHTHTDDEYIERNSLVPRAQAAALTIMRHLALPTRRPAELPATEEFSLPDQR